jgi:P-type E1-E2 ATPase
MLLIIAALMAIGNNYLYKELSTEHFYTYEGIGGPKLAVSAFFSFIIIMNSMIPMDLIVGLEAIYMIGRQFIENDHMMAVVDSEVGCIQKCKVQTLNLVEELAEINYMFCDKTGTLTQNILTFKKVAIAGKD